MGSGALPPRTGQGQRLRAGHALQPVQPARPVADEARRSASRRPNHGGTARTPGAAGRVAVVTPDAGQLDRVGGVRDRRRDDPVRGLRHRGDDRPGPPE